MTINIEITYSPDMAQLAAIHTACFEKGWNERAIRDLFAINGTVAFLVPGGKGFALLRRLGDEAEILTLAVIAPHRKQGIAKAVVAFILEWAQMQAIKTIFLEVRQSNIAAQELYRRTGFEVVSSRKDYYHSVDGLSEDAVVMRYRR